MWKKMVYHSEFTNQERNWLNRMLCAPILYKEIIVQQLNHAKIKREYTKYYISLKFELPDDLQAVPILFGVPIEMRVIKKKSVPIQFLLHLQDGKVSELEVICADSSEINISRIFCGLYTVQMEIDKRFEQDLCFEPQKINTFPGNV